MTYFVFIWGLKTASTRETVHGTKSILKSAQLDSHFHARESESLSKINEKIGVTVDQWTMLSHSRIFLIFIKYYNTKT